MWVADPAAGQVSRIDPGTGAQVARVLVGGEPGAIAGGGGSIWVAGPAAVWVAGQGAGTISRIDPRTDQVTATIACGP